MPGRRAGAYGAALAVYLAGGWAVAAHGAGLSQIWGGGADPYIFIWSLAWWPYALGHHLNPFLSHMVWAPQGLDMGWATSVPVLALLAWPVTVTLGPVAAYDLLTLAAPVLAAWAAFGVCWHLTRRFGAALIGGALFGFSSYMMARQNEQLNMSFTALVPLLVWLVLLRLEGRVGRKAFVLGGALGLAAQAGISLEVFATLCVNGALAWGLALWLVPARRAALLGVAGDGLMAAPVLLVLLAPLLWALFALPHDLALPKFWPYVFVLDPLNLIVPTRLDVLGGAWFAPLSGRFPGFVSEQAGYVGLPGVVVLWWALRRGRDYLRGLLLGVMVLACGPALVLAGHVTGLPMPWALLHGLPLMSNALPARMMLYASLVIAVVVALWLAEAPTRGRYMLAMLMVLALWPTARPVQAVPGARFFAPPEVREALGVAPRLCVLPFGLESPAIYWQVESGFGFSQVAGYLGFPPKRLQGNATLMRGFFGLDDLAFPAAFLAYCRAQGADDIVAGPGTAPGLVSALERLGVHGRVVDDAVVLSLTGGAP
ncbi:hypothetical protein [Acidocella sp.]|uniref:hypothetical protein n=1 Tax=Acidocella sp. TaxID=50710 RepID=UPI00260D7108|nr:hypothetical protein [Acidocella sp.]